MEFMLESLDRKDFLRLMHIVRSRGLKGDHGTWDEFMKSKFPRREDRFLTPVRRSKEDLIAFFLTLQKKDDLQRSDHDDIPDSVLFKMRPIEFSDYSVYSRWHTLVKTTLAREDHPLDYFLSPPFEDWVITGIGRKKSRSDYAKDIDAIALCCEMVLCQNGSDSAVRVVAIDSDFKSLPTDLTYFTALKLDHTKVLDTSLVFEYEYSGEPPKKSNRYFETRIEFGRLLPRRPSLDSLCKGKETRIDA
ncbi:Small RNA degrading nuclease 2 [Raphanus sativus]|nr:Small RNA degrading nuclease 2 [Raphanus sativus]